MLFDCGKNFDVEIRFKLEKVARKSLGKIEASKNEKKIL